MSAPQTVLLNAVLLIVYFAAGKFGLSFFALIHPSASAVWLATGIAMAALLLGGLRLVPAIFVGAFLVNVTTAGSILSSLGIALGNTLEECSPRRSSSASPAAAKRSRAAAGILKFMAARGILEHDRERDDRCREPDARRLRGRRASSSAIWFTWWLGDAAGAVIVTPLIVLWWTNRSWGRAGRRARRGGAAARGDRRVGAVDVFSSRALGVSARVSVPRAARVGSAAFRPARDRERHCACSRSSRRRPRRPSEARSRC